MERFWTLRHLQQAALTELTATVIKDGLVRADTLPLVLPVMGADGLPRGARVRVRLGHIDEITLDVHGTVTERLDDAAAVAEPEDSEDAESEAAAGPLTISVDLDDADAPAPSLAAGDAAAVTGPAS
jgi:exoribonuclease-2